MIIFINIYFIKGFGDDITDEERAAGTEMLDTLGHFYCTWCQKYIRANKKSATRHQFRNKKHILMAETYGSAITNYTVSDNSTSSGNVPEKLLKRGRKNQSAINSANAGLTQAYIQGAKIPGQYFP